MRLFFVPIAAAFEAERMAERVDWAEVESCDSPGAGSKRGREPNGIQSVVDAALARLDELGWDRGCLVGDSHGQAATIVRCDGIPVQDPAFLDAVREVASGVASA